MRPHSWCAFFASVFYGRFFVTICCRIFRLPFWFFYKSANLILQILDLEFDINAHRGEPVFIHSVLSEQLASRYLVRRSIGDVLRYAKYMPRFTRKLHKLRPCVDWLEIASNWVSCGEFDFFVIHWGKTLYRCFPVEKNVQTSMLPFIIWISYETSTGSPTAWQQCPTANHMLPLWRSFTADYDVTYIM